MAAALHLAQIQTSPPLAHFLSLSLARSTSASILLLVKRRNARTRSTLDGGTCGSCVLCYYAAAFDAVHASGLPDTSPARIKAEELFTREIYDVVAFKGVDRFQQDVRLMAAGHGRAPPLYKHRHGGTQTLAAVEKKTPSGCPSTAASSPDRIASFSSFSEHRRRSPPPRPRAPPPSALVIPEHRRIGPPPRPRAPPLSALVVPEHRRIGPPPHPRAPPPSALVVPEHRRRQPSTSSPSPALTVAVRAPSTFPEHYRSGLWAATSSSNSPTITVRVSPPPPSLRSRSYSVGRPLILDTCCCTAAKQNRLRSTSGRRNSTRATPSGGWRASGRRASDPPPAGTPQLPLPTSCLRSRAPSTPPAGVCWCPLPSSDLHASASSSVPHPPIGAPPLAPPPLLGQRASAGCPVPSSGLRASTSSSLPHPPAGGPPLAPPPLLGQRASAGAPSRPPACAPPPRASSPILRPVGLRSTPCPRVAPLVGPECSAGSLVFCRAAPVLNTRRLRLKALGTMEANGFFMGLMNV
ncbi:hypothetical protein PR202_gb06494 [Eleusine coracana subsp. coracana]|uniref:Uncharacterized protein n=1 Tax=Eleusine coracana subsp. coracana TaxID=191504 RepID=A0AAV5E793_ELECO|nr:hypothetical protein PR202_gb06494 [Eleusine coracana subsp. coracana]